MCIRAQPRVLRVDCSRGQREEQGGKGRSRDSSQKRGPHEVTAKPRTSWGFNQADSDTAAIGARWSRTVGKSSGYGSESTGALMPTESSSPLISSPISSP